MRNVYYVLIGLILLISGMAIAQEGSTEFTFAGAWDVNYDGTPLYMWIYPEGYAIIFDNAQNMKGLADVNDMQLQMENEKQVMFGDLVARDVWPGAENGNGKLSLLQGNDFNHFAGRIQWEIDGLTLPFDGTRST